MVLLVWGIIGYRIISAVNPDEPQIKAKAFSANFNPKINTTTDSFSIQPVKRDPFLGTLATNKGKLKKRKNTVAATAKSDFVWPQIVYLGVVKDKHSKAENIYIISVEGNQTLLKKGKAFNEVTITKGNAKRLIVKYKGRLKEILLKK